MRPIQAQFRALYGPGKVLLIGFTNRELWCSPNDLIFPSWHNITSVTYQKNKNLYLYVFFNSGVTDLFHKCLDHVWTALKQRLVANHLGGNIITGLRSGALLICGSGTGAGVGCGKTALAHAVCHQLNQWPVCAHITVVECIPFRGLC